MNIHKYTRLTLLNHQEIWRLYQTQLWKVTHTVGETLPSQSANDLCRIETYQTPGIYSTNSTNQRFKTLQYGLKREAKRYNKFTRPLRYKRLPGLKDNPLAISRVSVCGH